MSGVIRKAARAVESARLWWRSRQFRRRIDVVPRGDIEVFGSPYGHWAIPTSLLGRDSVCYLIGTGTDITFDLALIARFGCAVHSFDPVLGAQEHAIAAGADEPRFTFHRFGIWDEDTELEFHEPVETGFVSHSATDMHGTEAAFTAPVRSIPSVMAELGHDHIDLLKISAEGSEYRILESLRASGTAARVIAVEFAQPSPPGAAEAAYDQLVRDRYDAVYVQSTPRVRKVTFVRR